MTCCQCPTAYHYDGQGMKDFPAQLHHRSPWTNLRGSQFQCDLHWMKMKHQYQDWFDPELHGVMSSHCHSKHLGSNENLYCT